MNKTLKNIRLASVIVFVMICKTALAQKSNDALLRDTTTIDTKLLEGFWETTDSLKSTIQFIDSSFKVILHVRNNYHPYYLSKDKQNRVSTSGYYPNWPPFFCNLNLLEPKVLEISFSQLGVPTYTIRCKKVDSKL
jgi:hypothetical protein